MALYTAENLLLSVPSLFTFSRHILRHTIVPPLDIEMSVIIMSYVLIFFIPGLQTISRSESYPVFIATFQDYFVLLGFLSTSFLSCTIFTAIHGPDFSRSQIQNLKLLKKWY